MTPLFILLKLSGFSQREAADYIGVAPSTIDKMSRGIRGTPDGVIRELSALIQQQETSAQQAIDQIATLVTSRGASEIEIGYPADDYEAQSLGFPTISAWGAMAARVIAASPIPVRLVPRGTTVGTAAAMNAREVED